MAILAIRLDAGRQALPTLRPASTTITMRSHGLKRGCVYGYHVRLFTDRGVALPISMLRSFLLLVLLATAAGLFPGSTATAALDPKTACRAEEIITSLAGTAPSKLDFFGTSTGKDSYRCEAYFSFKSYEDVWTRVNAMMPSLRKVEAACAADTLVKLPKLDALQLHYDITTAGQYRITDAGTLPTDPGVLSQRLRAQIAQLQAVSNADDAALRRTFARANCPLAKYPDIQ